MAWGPFKYIILAAAVYCIGRLFRRHPAATPKFRGKSVLIIDDHEEIRELCTDVLGGLGCRVLSAGEGDAGLELARMKQPDVIISDMRHPNLDGLRMVRKLRESCHDAKIILTSDRHTLRDSKSPDVDAYLMKPFSATDVVMAMNSLTKGLR